MRRRPLALGLVALALAAGCGASKTSGTQSLGTDYAAILKASAAKTTGATSSKISLTSTTKVSGQSISLSGEGAFAYAQKEGTFDLTIAGIGGQPPTKIAERITGGNLYLTLPGQTSFYKLSLTDLVGTSLANSGNPTSSLSTLLGVTGPVTKVGSEKIRGTSTTHYSGTVDIAKALKQLSGLTADIIKNTFSKAKVTTLPFDAYVDDQGRLRRLVQNITLAIKGEQAVVMTTVDLYDFGTKVTVEVPPADQVKDGASLLSAFKNGAG